MKRNMERKLVIFIQYNNAFVGNAIFFLKVSALTCQIKSNITAHLVSWLGMKGFTSKDGRRFNTSATADYCMGSGTLCKSTVSEHSLFFGIRVVQQLSRWFWICQTKWGKILLLELNKPLKMKRGCFGYTARGVNMRRSTWNMGLCVSSVGLCWHHPVL